MLKWLLILYEPRESSSICLIDPSGLDLELICDLSIYRYRLIQ